MSNIASECNTLLENFVEDGACKGCSSSTLEAVNELSSTLVREHVGTAQLFKNKHFGSFVSNVRKTLSMSFACDVVIPPLVTVTLQQQ